MANQLASVSAVARATTTTTLRHAIMAVGSSRRLIGIGIALFVFFAALNIMAVHFFQAAFGSVLQSGGVLTEPQRQQVLALFSASSGLSSSAIALLVVMLIPPTSRVTLTARMFGASPGAVAAGEFLPSIAVLALITLAAGGAPIWTIAAAQQRPLLAAVSLFAANLAVALTILTIRNVAIGGALRTRLNFTLSRALGNLLGMVILAVLLVDLIISSLDARNGMLGDLYQALWGAGVPASSRSMFASLGALAVATLLAFAAAYYSGKTPPLAVAWRILPLRPTRSRPALLTAMAREVLQYLRHPVTSVTFSTSAMIVALCVFAVQGTSLTPEIVLILVTVVVAAGAETAWGRTRTWLWIYSGDRRQIRQALLTQVAAVYVVQLCFFLSASLLIIPIEQFSDVLLNAFPTFTVLYTLCYLAGTVIPYSEESALGGGATSALVFAAESCWLLVESVALQDMSLLRPLIHLFTSVFALTVSCIIATRRQSV